jgi:lipoprotein NlpI
MADFKQALSINPRYKDAHLNAGNLMVTLGDFSGAVSEYTSLIALGGDARSVTDAHLKRGIARYLAADYGGAIGDLVKVGEIDPSRVREAFPGLADVDSRSNREACQDWNAAAANGAAAAKEYVDRYCR